MADGLPYLGRFLVVAGIVIILIGGVLMISPKIPWLGRLPGDILVEKKNFTFYFPLATSILISIVLTVIFWLLGRR